MDEPDPGARARRRSFNAEYKARVLAEYEALPEHRGERGALMRRKGLYTSHVAEWRRARDTTPAPGPKTRPGKRTAEEVELDRLVRPPRLPGSSHHFASSGAVACLEGGDESTVVPNLGDEGIGGAFVAALALVVGAWHPK